MDIHKPKPWHGWRDFLKEYGIIVLGVLTALAFEETAEALRWRHEVKAERSALHGEVQLNLNAILFPPKRTRMHRSSSLGDRGSVSSASAR